MAIENNPIQPLIKHILKVTTFILKVLKYTFIDFEAKFILYNLNKV